jgi:hypothetical protein
MNLNSKTLQLFLKNAVRELKGEWVLLGGTLLPALGIDIRSTVDIDLVGLSKKEAAQNLELMRLASAMGLSIESINQAAAFFLKNVDYTARDLKVLKKSKSAVIYRPSFALYLKLKTARLSPTDLLDCEAYFHYCKRADKLDIHEIAAILKRTLESEKSDEKKLRLLELQRIVAG